MKLNIKSKDEPSSAKATAGKEVKEKKAVAVKAPVVKKVAVKKDRPTLVIAEIRHQKPGKTKLG